MGGGQGGGRGGGKHLPLSPSADIQGKALLRLQLKVSFFVGGSKWCTLSRAFVFAFIVVFFLF